MHRSPPSPFSSAAVPTTTKTVLLVEDIPEQANILATLLRYSGYELLEAADGEAAVRVARDHHPDVILMDAGLPVLDGWQATQRIKQDPRTTEIPVIMVTAYALDADRERSVEVGCDSFLARPIAPRRVLEEVQHWIGPA